MYLSVPTGKMLSVPAGKCLALPIPYTPALRDGLLWTPSLRNDTRSIYDGGVVAYIDPESEEADADGTYFDSYGVMQDAILNVARIESDGYRQEERRTNLAIQSAALGAGNWAKSRVSVNDNQAVAPDGTTTADEIVEDGTAGFHLVTDVIANLPAVNTDCAFSVFMKANTRTFGLIRIADTGPPAAWTANTPEVSYDLITGVATILNGDGDTVQDAYMIQYPNGWWRCVLIGNSGDSGLITSIQCGPHDGSGAPTYTGDNASSIYACGYQAEYSVTVESSYIPTAASSVTRTSDYLRYTATGNISGTACTIAMAITPHLSGTANDAGRWFRWRAAHWIDCYINNGKWAVNLKDAGASLDLISTTTLVAGRRDVLVLTHDGTALEQKLYVNGVKEGPTRTKGLMTSVSTLMSIGSTSPNSNVVPGNYAHPRIYDRALSAAEAQAVTDEINGWMD